MSIQAVAWALEQDLPARPKLVLVSICNHASHTDGYCWLNAETIAGESSCTPRSVYKFVGGLVRNGYIRKAKRRGDDGKQRANDFWVMFGRPEAKWDWDAGLHDEGAAEEDNSIVADGESIGTDSTTSCEPGERISLGENHAENDVAPVEKHAGSPGPSEAAFTRYESLEPSKTKPEKDASARTGYVPRAYRPPPPLPDVPQGAILAGKEANLIFVFEGSRAWQAWVAFKRRTTGVSWTLTTTTLVDGKSRRGWRFPTLFPPDAPSTGPPTQPESLMTEEDHAVLAGEER